MSLILQIPRGFNKGGLHEIAPPVTSNCYHLNNLLIEIEPKGSDNLTNINEVFEGKPFNYVSLFSGVGGFEQALNKLGGTCVMASEIDKYANQAYEILYGHPTVGDVTKVAAEDVPDHDLLVGGFPCQAFSVAGKRLGFEEARGTLFFEIARIAKVKQPKAMLLENVKGLVGHDGGKTLDTIVQTLSDIGYTVDFEVINSKYFGVPQNRERIFIVAVRDDLIKPSPWEIGKRTDVVAKGKRRIAQIDGVKTFNYDYPEQNEVTVRLRDILESDVDEKFYLSEDKTAKLVAQLSNKEDCRQIGYIEKNMQGNRVYDAEGIGVTLASQTGGLGGKGVTLFNEPQMIGHIEGGGHDICKRVYDGEGISPTIPTGKSGNTTPKVAEPIVYGNLNHYGNDQMNRVYSTEGVSPTITVVSGGGREQKIAEEQKPLGEIDIVGYCKEGGYKANEAVYGDNGVMSTLCARDYKDPKRILLPENPKYRIRKLTPLECFRLQGFPDAEFDKLTANGISNSQLYKMAGNAVTVNVIDAIGKRLLRI